MTPFRLFVRPIYFLTPLASPVSAIAVRRQQQRNMISLALGNSEDHNHLREECLVFPAKVRGRVEGERPAGGSGQTGEYVFQGIDGHFPRGSCRGIGEPDLNPAVLVSLRLEDGAWGEGGRGGEGELDAD